MPNVIFDESGNFVIYASLLGIKVVNLVTNRVSRLLGKVENTERFMRVALYQVGTCYRLSSGHASWRWVTSLCLGCKHLLLGKDLHALLC